MSHNYKGKEALLLWCKTNTSGYNGVVVQNFHNSWKDGLAFCALVHKFHPEVLQFDALAKEKPLDNLELAFSEALKLGVPRLFDPSDMMIGPEPEQLSVMTYLSQMYHVFERNANPGMGIANITMVGPPPSLNSSRSEDNLTQHQVPTRERPKFTRSFSTSNLPIPTASGPQLQQRIPPLLTKSGTSKYVPFAKKAAQAPTEQAPGQVPQEALSPPPSPVLTTTKMDLATTTPIQISATTLVDLPPVPMLNGSHKDKESPPPSAAKTPAMNIPIANGPTPAKVPLSSSAPQTFPRSITTPSISVSSLVPTSPAKTSLLDSQATREDVPPKPTVLTFNPKPVASPPPSPISPTPISPSHGPLSPISPSPISPSPSPSPIPTSPSPSPTPPKTAVKVLSAKSAGEIIAKQPSTPPLQSRQPDTKLKRSQSVTNVTPKNWVSTLKGQGNFIRITDPKSVEIKKAEPREGPLSPSGSDDESNPKSPAPPSKSRFLVDKVSSSSRGTWLAKLQNRDDDDGEEEGEEEYEYVDDDPSRKYEPHFDGSIKLESCLLRSSSTGKLTLPPLNRERSLKKVTFKETLTRTESKEQEAPPVLSTQLTQEKCEEITISLTTKEDTKELVETQKATKMIKELERSRDEAVFHRDEIAAKYAELELRLKEERAANEAMERETVDLHQKLSAVQEHTEAKFTQKVTDMTQKLADKDREILKLRMQNTTMKKKVEERDRDIERLKNTRSFSPPPELPVEDLESDLECRQTWENAVQEIQTPSKSISYGGLKLSVDTSKVLMESPRAATASPRFEPPNVVKQYTPESPFSPDLLRRTSTPPLLAKPNTPTKGNESPQIEIAKVSYVYIRPHTPTKAGDAKFNLRPQTPTKVEIIKKPEGGSHHARSPSLDQLPRPDSQTRFTYQFSSPKSPEPVRTAVLSPKAGVRGSGGVAMSVDVQSGDTKESKATPGTPRIYGDVAPTGGLDPKLPKDEAPSSVKTEYRPGTLRSENSKPRITFSPPSSPSPSPRPTPSPSPSPKPTTVKYNPPIRHSSNPHSPSPNPNPASPRANSNPSPSQAPTGNKPPQYGSRAPSASPSPGPSPNPVSPSPNPPPSNGLSSSVKDKEKDKDKEHRHSKAAALLSFITRGRSNTLPSEMPGYSEANGNRVEHHAPVSLMSPRGGQKIEVGTAQETTADGLDDEYPPPVFFFFFLFSFLFFLLFFPFDFCK